MHNFILQCVGQAGQSVLTQRRSWCGGWAAGWGSGTPAWGTGSAPGAGGSQAGAASWGTAERQGTAVKRTEQALKTFLRPVESLRGEGDVI